MKRRLIFPGEDGFGDHLQELALSCLPKGQTVPTYLAKEFKDGIYDATMNQFEVVADHFAEALDDAGYPETTVEGKPCPEPEPEWSRRARKNMGHIWIVAWLAIRAKYHDGSIGN